MRILLASKSKLKLSALVLFLDKQFSEVSYDIKAVDCDFLPQQPINCGDKCTYQRLIYAYDEVGMLDLCFAIESDVVKLNGIYYDRAHVRVESNGIVGIGVSQMIECPMDVREFEDQHMISFSDKIKGYDKTAGKYIAKKYGSDCDQKNWMLHTAQINRVDQIEAAITTAYDNYSTNYRNAMILKSLYDIYPNFPIHGVSFKYFYSLFSYPQSMHMLADIIEAKYSGYGIDFVLALESRGLVLGALIADRLKVPLIPVQKPGKLPGDVISMPYTKEYGKDELQISRDLLKRVVHKQEHILIVDDLIGTGGTIRATLDCLEKIGMNFKISIMALDQVEALKEVAQNKIQNTYEILFS
jgi:adenine phosphoribosyltransferase